MRDHVKHFGEWLNEKYDIEVETVIDYPKDRKTGKRITFKDVILTKGYPIVSKEVSKVINDARHAINKNNYNSYAIKQLNGEYINPHTGLKSPYNKEKWKYLIDSPFKIFNQCCNIMKKGQRIISRRTQVINLLLEQWQVNHNNEKHNGLNMDAILLF